MSGCDGLRRGETHSKASRPTARSTDRPGQKHDQTGDEEEAGKRGKGQRGCDCRTSPRARTRHCAAPLHRGWWTITSAAMRSLCVRRRRVGARMHESGILDGRVTLPIDRSSLMSRSTPIDLEKNHWAGTHAAGEEDWAAETDAPTGLEALHRDTTQGWPWNRGGFRWPGGWVDSVVSCLLSVQGLNLHECPTSPDVRHFGLLLLS